MILLEYMTNQNDKKPTKTPEEVRAYMRMLGKRGAAVNKQKGSAYFRWVRSHGKKKENENE